MSYITQQLLAPHRQNCDRSTDTIHPPIQSHNTHSLGVHGSHVRRGLLLLLPYVSSSILAPPRPAMTHHHRLTTTKPHKPDHTMIHPKSRTPPRRCYATRSRAGPRSAPTPPRPRAATTRGGSSSRAASSEASAAASRCATTRRTSTWTRRTSRSGSSTPFFPSSARRASFSSSGPTRTRTAPSGSPPP